MLVKQSKNVARITLQTQSFVKFIKQLYLIKRRISAVSSLFKSTKEQIGGIMTE